MRRALVRPSRAWFCANFRLTGPRGQHRNGPRPRLVHGNETGKKPLELRRRLPCGHEKRPRANVVYRLKPPRETGRPHRTFGTKTRSGTRPRPKKSLLRRSSRGWFWWSTCARRRVAGCHFDQSSWRKAYKFRVADVTVRRAEVPIGKALGALEHRPW